MLNCTFHFKKLRIDGFTLWLLTSVDKAAALRSLLFLFILILIVFLKGLLSLQELTKDRVEHLSSHLRRLFFLGLLNCNWVHGDQWEIVYVRVANERSLDNLLGSL